MSNNYLNNIERDQLTEVISIGAGNASTALSKMVGKRIKMEVPEILVDRVEEAYRFLGKSQELTSAVLLKLEGDTPGIMMLLFPPRDTLKLLEYLTKKPKGNINELDYFDRSALREVGNILSGATLAAFANFLNIKMIESVPEEAIDMLGSVVDSVLAEIGQESDIILIFKVKFIIPDDGAEGQLFFLFNPKSTTKILELTKKKMFC